MYTKHFMIDRWLMSQYLADGIPSQLEENVLNMISDLECTHQDNHGYAYVRTMRNILVGSKNAVIAPNFTGKSYYGYLLGLSLAECETIMMALVYEGKIDCLTNNRSKQYANLYCTHAYRDFWLNKCNYNPIISISDALYIYLYSDANEPIKNEVLSAHLQLDACFRKAANIFISMSHEQIISKELFVQRFGDKRLANFYWEKLMQFSWFYCDGVNNISEQILLAKKIFVDCMGYILYRVIEFSKGNISKNQEENISKVDGFITEALDKFQFQEKAFLRSVLNSYVAIVSQKVSEE